MSDGWRSVRLSELCDLKPPKSIARSMLSDDDEVSFVPMSDLGELEKCFEGKEVRVFKEVVDGYVYFADGDVLCAKITPCFENGKLGVASGLKNGIGFGSSEFVVMRSRGKLLPDYLFHFLSRDDFRQAGERVMTGAVGHKRVPKEFFEDLEVPLPPLDEQKRIVAVLDQAFAALDRARANAEANLADADELLGQASAKVIEGAAVGGMRSLRLGEVTSRLTNGYVGPTRDIYQEDGVPYLLARHVRDGSLRFDGRTHVSSEFNQKHKKSMLKRDDVLLVQSGHIGHCAVVPEEHHGHNCHAMIVMTPKDELISGKYLSAVLNTPLFQAEFQRIRTGSTVPHLTCGMVRELVVEVPERAQQDRIVTELETLSSHVSVVRSRYTAELGDLASLRQSLLQSAFSGQLT